jgi:large subunit ribosomal protein L34e
MPRIKRKTPGKKTLLRFKREKTGTHRCAACGAELHGMKKLTQSELRKLSKSERRPSRPYGGHLCGECMRELFKDKARKQFS